MSDELEAALDAHHRFDAVEDGYEPTEIIFQATVTAGDGTVRIVDEVPTLDAAVADETVAPVVEDGWYETFERRVEDVGGVTTTDDVRLVSVRRDAETVSVETVLESAADAVAEDALAVVNYVEGTWVEGIIPGYDYVERVQAVRDRARRNAED